MRVKQRRPIRLWLVLILAFTLLLSLITAGIILSYRLALEHRYERDLRQQLTEGLAQLSAEGYSQEAAAGLDDRGIRVLLAQSSDNRILYQNGELFLIPWQKPEGGPANGAPAEDAPAEGGGPSPRRELESLVELVNENLGGDDGSFFLTDRGLGGKGKRSLESKALLLCGREGDILFCLLLPVESTNAAINLAVRYATIVNLAAWVVSLVLLYWLSKLITRPHRRIGQTAAQIADLDFSQRCPPALTTELNELSQSINSMADSLEANVNELREANERMQAELNERIRQQQITAELIANLSHDLKTPIAIISGYAEGLREGVARTPEKQQAYYEMILQESEHMQAIVSSILALGRMESGETPIRAETFDLVRLLKELLGSFQRELERQGICLECPDWPPACPVRTDYACARQSLMNYVQNAVYHINGGSRIRVRLEDRGGAVRVRVTNSSAPIPEAEAARLWDKLYRGDPSRQRRNGEMGLGLAIVKGNMERLGHPYGFENDPDFPGVCFWLELPKAEDPGSTE